MIDKNSIIEINNVLPDNLLKEFQTVLNGYDFPWYYNDGATAKDNHPQFTHVFYDHRPISDWWIYPFTINNFIAKELDINMTPRRVKANYQYPLVLSDIDKLNRIHADMQYESEGFYSFIYYPFDCDGDTILYNHFYGDDLNDLSIAKSYTPKENSALFFYSHRLHQSMPPVTNKKRIVLNFVNSISSE